MSTKELDLNLTQSEVSSLNESVSHAVSFENTETKKPFYVIHTDQTIFEQLSYLDKRDELLESGQVEKVGEYSLVIDEDDFRALQNFLGEYLEREMQERATRR